jgi:hypothetical protein
MRFNAPPTWPQPPEGWTPHPGWSPDPAWGPAPDGWQFWVDDAETNAGAGENEPLTQPLPASDPEAAHEVGSTDRPASRRSGAALARAWTRATTSFRRDRSDIGADSSAPERQKSRTKPIVMAVGGVALFAGGLGIGGAVASDPTSSDEYAALASAKADVEEDYESLQTDYDTMSSGLQDRHTELQKREDEVVAAEKALDEREGDVEEAESAVEEREEAVSGTEQKKAENTIREGTWTVGVDIAPGTYRSTADVGSRCYWAILASGTNGDDIIANDIPGGGRPTVTLAEGQDFETKRCGTWEPQ